MYPGAGKEWFSVQHWISVQESGASAAVLTPDAPLATLGDINRGAWPSTFENRGGTIFSYVMNNYWKTNYRAAQGGHFQFHYTITSGVATNPMELGRMGWEYSTPLEADLITAQDKAFCGKLPDASTAQRSFLAIDDPNILLETWKPAEDEKGMVFRFVDLGGKVRTVTITSPVLHLAQVWQSDALERGRVSLPLQTEDQFGFTAHPHEIVTIRAIEKEP
jgi:alpha-mannosidase